VCQIKTIEVAKHRMLARKNHIWSTAVDGIGRQLEIVPKRQFGGRTVWNSRQALTIRVASEGEAVFCVESPNCAHTDGVPFTKISKSHRLAIAISTRDQRARKNAAFDNWFDITLATSRKTNNQAATITVENAANRGLADKFQADRTK
jgi:hypothetical protein